LSDVADTASRAERNHGARGLVLDDGPRAPSDGHWLLRNPVRSLFLLIVAASLVVRFAVLKDGFFLTDDYMLTTRAVENPFGWDYLTRVHTGHFEPVGFAVMWLLAHFATLDWAVAVLVMMLAQLVLSVQVWRLLVELFGRRKLTLVPFGLFAFSTLTLPAFSWLSAAIIWVPLMISIAGVLLQHTRYLRTLQTRHAAAATGWLLLGMASFEKVLVLLPFLVAFSFVLVPQLRMAPRVLLSFLRQTWPIWLAYSVATVGYLALYVSRASQADVASGFRAPGVGTLGDFAYLTIMQTFVPGALGGPWDWTPVSEATAIVSSPRAFDWTMWLVAAALVGVTLALRRRAARMWTALGVYLAFSIVALGISRVPLIGAVAGLETRYVADAVLPLTVAVGFFLMPLRGESDVWYPTTLGIPRQHFRRAVTGGVTALVAVGLGLSLHSMSGYAAVHASNPNRDFVETARRSLAALPADGEVYDTGMPRNVIGPLFLEYNLVSRFLAPLADAERRSQLYSLTQYTNPYLLDTQGNLVKMKVDGIGSPPPLQGFCGWSSSGGEVRAPLTADVFPWTWAVRIGYLADGPTTGTVHLGKGSHPVTLTEGLGEVYITITGGDREIRISDLDPGVKVCIGDVVVGNPVPASPAS
jgi:hypothetical protein